MFIHALSQFSLLFLIKQAMSSSFQFKAERNGESAKLTVQHYVPYEHPPYCFSSNSMTVFRHLAAMLSGFGSWFDVFRESVPEQEREQDTNAHADEIFLATSPHDTYVTLLSHFAPCCHILPQQFITFSYHSVMRALPVFHLHPYM